MKKVAVVILNYNGIAFLQQFLPSLILNTHELGEIIIADNASIDNSIEFLKAEHPKIKVIQIEKNLGFAGGYNEALKNLQYEYFLLLNSDIEVCDNWLEPLIKFMDATPEAGACQPKILDYKNKLQFEYAGAGGGYMDYLAYPFCRGRIFDNFEEDKGQYNDIREVFWATGACMMVRSKIFNKLGGFDANYFAHQEEIDLCWRMKNQGYKVFIEPEATVYHVGGGTLSSTNPKKTYLNFRNSLLNIIKNIPKKYFFSTVTLRLLLDGVAGLKLITEGKFSHTFAIIKAHFSVYAQFFSYLKKRNNLPEELPSCFYKKSLVFESFWRGKKKFTELDMDAFTELPSSK